MPRPHQALNDSTPVHLVISTAESLGQTSCDALATALEPQLDWGWMPPPPPPKKKKKKKKIKKKNLCSRNFLLDNFLIEVTCYCELLPDYEQTCL